MGTAKQVVFQEVVDRVRVARVVEDAGSAEDRHASLGQVDVRVLLSHAGLGQREVVALERQQVVEQQPCHERRIIQPN